jgi:hypothetical protein
MMVMAMAVPLSASAAPIDDARALIDAIQATGDSDRAWQMTQLVNSMSSAELQAFSDVGIAKIAELMDQQRAAIERAREAGYRPPEILDPVDSEPAGHPRNHVDEYPVFTDYTPDNVSCPNSPAQTQLNTIVDIRTTLVAAGIAYKLAKAIYDSTDPACHQLVVAIGVGSNPGTAVCIGLGIAETVVRVLFDVAHKSLELIDFCDDEVDYAKIRATFHGLEYIHDQLETHDTDMKTQLGIHDVEAQALVDQLITRLTRIEGKVDLLLKSQLEIAMDRRGGRSRPSVFYEERLDELCDYAQEAVNELPLVYLVAPQAQQMIVEGNSLKLTDPKLAADTCVRAFVRATSHSARLQ